MHSQPERDELLWELRSSRSATRRAALRELADCPRADLFEAVLETLDSDDARVREAAAHALARYGDPRAVQPLVQAVVRGGPEAHAAARALGGLGKPAALAVCEAMERTERSWIDRGIQNIRGFLDMDERDNGPNRARKLLTNVLRALRDPETVKTLRHLAQDAHPGVWYTALQALQRIGTEEAREAMRHTLTHGRPESRTTALRHLARLRDRQAVPAILPLLAHSAPGLRREAADALVVLLAPESRHLIRDFRAFAVGGGALVTRQEAIPLLCVVADGGPEGLRYRAVESLNLIASRRPCRALLEALPALRKCVADEEDDHRREFYRSVLHRFEGLTARFILPVPAAGAGPDGSDLPLPAMQGATNPGRLPLAGHE